MERLSPVFIIGCGRSGTTIFGTTLSQHPKITYLNEPRGLWSKAYPETDIWSSNAGFANGKLVLTEKDVCPKRSKSLIQLFQKELLLAPPCQSQILIEKLPINNFRLRFIHKIFPLSKFIHLFRNGVEVANSIKLLADKGKWFGENMYKWNELVEYAEGRESTIGLAALCNTNYLRGLLEWRLSTEAAIEFLHSLSVESYFELSYDNLLKEPDHILTTTLDFIGLPKDINVEGFITKNLSRRTKKIENILLSEEEKLIGGSLLPVSMRNGNKLVKNI